MRLDARHVLTSVCATLALVGWSVTSADAAPITFANAVMADSPIAYWRLNELSLASPAADSSGNGHNGTYSSSGIVLGQPGIGGGDTGALFNSGGAVNGRIVVPNDVTLDPPNITLEALIDWDGTNGFQQRIIEKSRFTGGELPNYGLNILPDGRVLFEIQVGITQPTLSSIGAVGFGPALVAATYDGTLMRIYINGVLDSTQAVPTPGPIPFVLTDVGIGNQVDRDRPFNGMIDELAIFRTALSADRLAAHNQAVSAVPEPATIAMVSIGLASLAGRARARRRRRRDS